MAEWSDVMYARTRDGVHLAYQEAGSGPDLLLLLDGFVPIDSMDDEWRLAGALRRIAGFSHAIRFDRRGIGLSDPTTPDAPPTLEQWLDDAEAVLDAAGCRDAIVLGDRAGTCIAAGLAALRPHRVRSLVLVNGFARFLSAPDHSSGADPALIEHVRERVLQPDHPDGPFDIIRFLAPSVADDVRFRAWWDRTGRRAASPATARSLRHVIEHLDVRGLLPSIAVPTLVVHRRDVATAGCEVEQGRLLAQRIDRSRYVELPGPDAVWYVGDTDRLLDEIEAFATGEPPIREPRGDLLTVLFTDIVDSTAQAAALGDHDWTQLLDRYEEAAHRQVLRWRGIYVKSTGDGSLAAFDGPIRAVQCAIALSAEATDLGLELRCGLHTGPVERRGRDVGGMAVHVAARVLSRAGPGEVLATGVTADLLVGSPVDVHERGDAELKGVPGRWRLCATSQAPSGASG